MLLKEFPLKDNTQSIADYAETVAKAQLKKDSEHIRNLPTDGHDKWYWYNQDLAKDLLKEVDPLVEE